MKRGFMCGWAEIQNVILSLGDCSDRGLIFPSPCPTAAKGRPLCHRQRPSELFKSLEDSCWLQAPRT